MKIRLIQYSKKLPFGQAFRVIIDNVKFDEENETINILFANEIGIQHKTYDLQNDVSKLADIYKSCKLTIPIDFVVDTNDLVNRTLFIKINQKMEGTQEKIFIETYAQDPLVMGDPFFTADSEFDEGPF